MAGFRGPLFLLGLSVAATQAGYTSVLPIPFTGGTTTATQAGFVCPIPFINLGAGQPVPEVEEPQAGGGGAAFREEIKRNDDDRVIMAVITKFLTLVNE